MDLRHYLESKDIWVRILEAQDYEGLPISSSRIRDAVKDGKITAANEMLGYSFTFESEVIAGDERGRQIAFPQ
jgi:riboflavin kinase/FMN adenylyltransferase